jgi:predicted nucleotidyltransferase
VTIRYAILDDNQRLLEQRLEQLRAELPALVSGRACAVMVIGSVAEGCARDQSDLDLLVVLSDGTPRRSDYEWWDREVAPHLLALERFPVQPVIVGRSALVTTEPHLRQALRRGIRLWDPERIFR